jgi:hypothetical protein
MLLSEYQYYNPTLNEAPEDDELTDVEGEEGDDLEDSEDSEDSEELGLDGGDLEGEDEGGEDFEEDFEDTEPVEEDEVEVDVSGIVDGINTNADKITSIDQKISSLGNNIDNSINKMIQNNAKLVGQISQLEKNMNQELIKRAPTPNEELMMRSMSSYPYNQKLTDYWKPAKGEEYNYSIENPRESIETQDNPTVSQKDETPKEFKLTDKEIDDDYSEYDVKNSF